MQKIATRIFIYASIVFGIIGVLLVLTLPGKKDSSDGPNIVLLKLLLTSGFIVVSSFAISVAGKYLNGKS